MVDLKLEIPESFFEEEVREGFFVSSEMKKVWAVELDLLNEFMRVCNKYGIKYYTAAGTTIGALRHGGFIPWDDDIDVMMTREEYRKLEKIASKEFCYPYFWQTEATDPESFRVHAQLRNSLTTGILVNEFEGKYKFNQGIFLDVFPLDYIPDDETIRKKYFSELVKKKKRMTRYLHITLRFIKREISIKQFVKRIVHFLLTVGVSEQTQYKVMRKYYDDFDNSIQSYATKNTDTVCYLISKPGEEKCIWDKKWLETTIEVPFEMLKVPVPIGYESLLRKQYGEWKTPSQQPTMHGEVIFDVDKSYKEYIQTKKDY